MIFSRTISPSPFSFPFWLLKFERIQRTSVSFCSNQAYTTPFLFPFDGYCCLMTWPNQQRIGDCVAKREDQNYSTIWNRKDQLIRSFLLVVLLRYFFGGDIGAWITHFVISFRENSKTVIPWAFLFNRIVDLFYMHSYYNNLSLFSYRLLPRYLAAIKLFLNTWHHYELDTIKHK